MNLNQNQAIPSLFKKTYDEGCRLPLQFEDASSYNAKFRFTFERTVQEVNSLGRSLRILEIGAFTGVVAVTLARLGHEVTGSDVNFVINDSAIAAWFDSEGVKRIAVNLTKDNLPIADASFDVIVFHSVLAHLNVNPIPILREFSRVLAPGGRVYCETPNLLAAKNMFRMIMRRGFLSPVEHMVWNLKPNMGMSVGLMWREYTKEELIGLYEVAGFKLEKHRFVLRVPNLSSFPRKQFVALMYQTMPSLMPSQIAIFQKL
jgi:SAM-dependent methyltransferase